MREEVVRSCSALVISAARLKLSLKTRDFYQSQLYKGLLASSALTKISGNIFFEKTRTPTFACKVTPGWFNSPVCLEMRVGERERTWFGHLKAIPLR